MDMGALCFGLVIGFVTYRSIRQGRSGGLSDLAAVIGATGGAAVLALFPAGSVRFDYYATGLAIGFFAYLILSLIIASKKGAGADREFLGG